MMENQFKDQEPRSASIFSKMEKLVRFTALFEDGLPVRYLPRVLFITTLLILYIANSHYAEKTIRKIDKMQAEVEDLRADFTSLKADYMYARLQSEVAKQVKPMELEESSQPPYKIMVKK